MSATRAARWIQRADAAEHRLCLRLNRGCASPAMRNLFRLVSRLGDGVFWYLVMLLLPVLYGERGLVPALQMAVASVLGVGLYSLLKARLVRERPYITHAGIEAHSAPLDRYSFPSGHTLHAVSFTLLATVHFPELAFLLVPMTLLIAASRVVLGLHYPSDVLAGAALGGALAASVLTLTPL
jgi:undecaprenyl-diphosphatase